MKLKLQIVCLRVENVAGKGDNSVIFFKTFDSLEKIKFVTKIKSCRLAQVQSNSADWH